MEVEILHTGEVRFEAVASGHRAISDQPLDSGGADTGMLPPELLLAALGTCAGFYAVEYLKARALTVPGLKVKVTADKALKPSRLGHFRIEVTAPELDPAHHTGILRAVKACLVHNTLTHPPTIDIVLNTAAGDPAV